MQSFQWMVGSWTMKTKNGAIMETWVSINDSSMAGESIMIKATGGAVQLENVRLIHRDNVYYYCPTAHGQNNEQEIKFNISSFTDAKFVAENTEHDFPKRISYMMIAKDSVHAQVDDGMEPPVKKSEFHYSRFKN